MKGRSAVFAFAVAGLFLSSHAPVFAAQAASTAAATAAPANVTGAVADPNRPQGDKDLDARRKPADMLAFAGVEAGDKVLELVPGQGYMTRLLAKAVGANGHVYAANLPTFNERFKTGVDPIVNSSAYGNVSKIEQPFGQLRAPEQVDLVWTSENYHDFKNMGMFATDTAAMNRAIFAALKPGGTYIVTDYVGAAGSGTRDTQSLHRIDPEIVKAEARAAGFMLEGESNVLMSPGDNLTARSRQGSSQFMLKFRKPAN